MFWCVFQIDLARNFLQGHIYIDDDDDNSNNNNNNNTRLSRTLSAFLYYRKFERLVITRGVQNQLMHLKLITFMLRVWMRKISSLPFSSGTPISISRSNLSGRE